MTPLRDGRRLMEIDASLIVECITRQAVDGIGQMTDWRRVIIDAWRQANDLRPREKFVRSLIFHMDGTIRAEYASIRHPEET